MKKGNFFASVFAVFIGILTIVFAIAFGGNSLSIAVLIFIYFFGATLIFIKVSGEDAVAKLSSGEVLAIYGPRFWLLMAVGAIASCISGYLFFKSFNVTIFPAIHFGLGTMSILTAFVSPRLMPGDPMHSRFPENEIFD